MIKIQALLPRLLPCIMLIAPLAARAAATAKPNIIFLLSDDQRWDCLGAAGNPNIHTPNMDRLAREGVYFNQATIANSQCACSRALLLTGLSNHTNGRYSNQSARKDILNSHGFDKYHCLPEVLSENGYHTAFVGKWHCSTDPWNIGFQEVGAWHPSGSGPYKDTLVAHGKSRDRTRQPGFLQEILGDSACSIIREHADNDSTQPLFLWLATTAPHSPYQPDPEEAMAPYRGKTTKDVVPPTWQGDISNSDYHHWIDYVTATTSVDNELGKVMKTLDETGMSTNTVVVFMSDNGYMMGNRGWHGKIVPYEDSIKVPILVWGPGIIDAKGVTDAVASSLDLPPTFVKLAGIDPPKEWQGRDLTPVLKDGKPHGITWAVTEAPDYHNYKFPQVAYRAVRTTASKLIVWDKRMNKEPEFYDLASDPQERYNLYTMPVVKSRVEALTKILKDWMTATDDNWEMRGEVVQTGSTHLGKKKSAGKHKKARRSTHGKSDS